MPRRSNRQLQRYGPYRRALHVLGNSSAAYGAGKYLLSSAARAAGRYAWSKYSSKGKSNSLQPSAHNVGKGGMRARMYKGRIGKKRGGLRKRKKVTCKKLASKVRKLEHLAKQGLATYRSVKYTHTGHNSNINFSGAGIYVQADRVELDTLLAAMPVLDNTVSPNVYNLEDFTNNGAGEIMMSATSQYTVQNNGTAPCTVEVVNFRPRGLTDVGPNTLMQQDMADQPLAITSPSALYTTNFLVDAHDRRWVTMHENWRVQKVGTVCLKPGEKYSFKVQSRKNIDLSSWDNHVGENYIPGATVETIIRFRGSLAHDDTTIANVGIGPSYCDVEKIQTINLKFEAPAQYIYESRTSFGDALSAPKTNPGLACPSVTPNAD